MSSYQTDIPDCVFQVLTCPFIICELKYFDDQADVRVVAYKHLLIVGHLSEVATNRFGCKIVKPSLGKVSQTIALPYHRLLHCGSK